MKSSEKSLIENQMKKLLQLYFKGTTIKHPTTQAFFHFDLSFIHPLSKYIKLNCGLREVLYVGVRNA